MAVKRLLHLVKSQFRKSKLRHTAGRFDRPVESILFDDPEGLFEDQSFDFSPFERWVLLQRVLSASAHPALHFLHVPKTGGTTLTAALAADRRFLVVSLDGRRDSFIQQLRKVFKDDQGKLVFIRAHHGLSLVRQSGVADQVQFSFTTIRNPAAIHASNANMIVRRIQCLTGKQVQSPEEREYAMRWLNTMQGRHDDDTQFAVDVLAMPEYLAEMGAVYSKMFDVPDWKEEVRSGRLLCFDLEQLDRLFADGFGYDTPPVRKNVSTDGPLHAGQIPDGILDPLIETDLEIFRFLADSRSDPQLAAMKLRALMEA